MTSEARDLPPRMDLPVFAYGIFQPGQLAYFQLGDSVDEWRRAVVRGALLVRDGLPIADLSKDGMIEGAVVTFKPGDGERAYQRIAVMEPKSHYEWRSVEVEGAEVNMLVGCPPNNGNVPYEEPRWDGWDDPSFTVALDVIQETLDDSATFAWDLKPLFRLQMAYLLLWSSIERYASLRYHLGGKSTRKVVQLVSERAFGRSLIQHVDGTRRIYRADRSNDPEVLDPERPDKSLKYYYQVRSNITHRGKAVVRDHETLRQSLTELLAIFRDVLCAAKSDAEDLAIRDAPASQGSG